MKIVLCYLVKVTSSTVGVFKEIEPLILVNLLSISMSQTI